MLRNPLTLLFLLLLLPWRAGAEYSFYSANLENASWSVVAEQGRCELTHIIPYYGTATFLRRPGSEMIFFVSTNREEAEPVDAVV